MNVVTCINTVRDTLRSYLTDLYVTAGGSRSSDSYIFGDEPITSPKYPQIQILKLENNADILDIGSTYMVRDQVFLNIWVYSKNGFKVTISGTEYVNANLVEYYMGLIKETLKDKFSYMDNLGVRDYRYISTSKVGYEPSTQLYFGAVTIRVEYFTRNI